MGRPAKYPPEFHREAVSLLKSSGRPVAEVARSLGIIGQAQSRSMSAFAVSTAWSSRPRYLRIEAL